MQTAQIDNSFEFSCHPQEQTFSSVWGNEMQREDFLALASGLRHYSASLMQVGYIDGVPGESAVVVARGE
ncbi:hypothetical protein [Pseudomonas huanghezhanensis]|uniref:hypothetical protein n=1 Tax=Pseudomonas huanghezhanensis TaxID=3002903 RepID=UPI00228603CA|nr:hypothetical protein [Pseudomonas sp. BSw22131]